MSRRDVALLRARHVWLGDAGWLSPGEVVLDGGRIAAVRRARGRVDDVLLLPGLVDAHVHLQLAPLRTRERAFLPWVRAVIAAQRGRPPAALRETATAALRELLRTGTTAVGEIDSTGLSPAALRGVPLAGRCYQEVLGFDVTAAAAHALLRRRAVRGTRACPAGLSPHAPYSTSAALVAAAVRRGAPLAIHCAEVPEEQQFLHTGRGPFAELLAELGRLPPRHRAPGLGAVRWLERHGALSPRTHLVHCQELEAGDAARIAAAGAAIVVCPGTIEWFGRSAPPLGDWLARGITVGLGTDSRASNTALSMRRELQRAAVLWPGLSPAQLLALATTGGAAALQRHGLGRIARGARADLLAVAAPGERPDAALQRFVHGRGRVCGVWLAGRRVLRAEPAGVRDAAAAVFAPAASVAAQSTC